ncbi:RsmE family RNA methyltransferase, partial [Staphylococcus aureus]
MKPGQSVLCIFGPEGGISEKELLLLEEANAKLAGLGPRILRTETAPLYVLSAASFYFDLYKNKNR